MSQSEWKDMCRTSCDDFCSDDEEMGKLCKHRCTRNLCSIIDEKCDINEDSELKSCHYVVGSSITTDTDGEN